jgi:hypothetical protein
MVLDRIPNEVVNYVRDKYLPDMSSVALDMVLNSVLLTSSNKNL